MFNSFNNNNNMQKVVYNNGLGCFREKKNVYTVTLNIDIIF